MPSNSCAKWNVLTIYAFTEPSSVHFVEWSQKWNKAKKTHNMLNSEESIISISQYQFNESTGHLNDFSSLSFLCPSLYWHYISYSRILVTKHLMRNLWLMYVEQMCCSPLPPETGLKWQESNEIFINIQG